MRNSVKKAIGATALCLAFGAFGVQAFHIVCGSAETAAETEKVSLLQEQSKQSDSPLKIEAKSSYLMEYSTGTVIHEQNASKRLPIASMCKIMTLLLSFDAIENGDLGMEETITVSERAASMGGSQVFLEENGQYPVKELIKSIVVCSANDSCVAMAERIAGGEELFVDKMNEKAKVLGATDTLFANCTGLPKEPQYSCAKDVAIMLKALLNHPEYYEFGKVWIDKFQHPEGRYTEISNTNKLVRFYEGCDGGKTGFTNDAGFCLAATAKRNDMRVISVVIGSENSKKRFDGVRQMFDYAFANYTLTPIMETGVAIEERALINGGKEKSVCITPERNACVFLKRGEKANITTEVFLEQLKAPISQGQKAGELVVYKDGVEIDRIALIALNEVGKANFFDRLQDIGKNWNKRKTF